VTNPMPTERVSLISLPDPKAFDLKEIGRKAAETAEREHIRNTLTYTNWNRKAAAKLLQVSYKALLYKIEKYRLDGGKNKKD
jgi:transcriptional regulator with PAS, ATPase and Fis domain